MLKVKVQYKTWQLQENEGFFGQRVLGNFLCVHNIHEYLPLPHDLINYNPEFSVYQYYCQILSLISHLTLSNYVFAELWKAFVITTLLFCLQHQHYIFVSIVHGDF